MYIPSADQILSVPRFDNFFRADRSVDILVSQIASKARTAEGLGSEYTWKTIRAIAASPWNRGHIQYDTTGYENYNIEGPQYARRYSTDPIAMPGTGNQYPVIWIPDPDDPQEPEILFSAAGIEEPIAAIETEEPIADLLTTEAEADQIVADLADPAREIIIIEPTTPAAIEAAEMVRPILPTETEAVQAVAAAELAQAAADILADENATAEERAEALRTMADLSDSVETDPETREAVELAIAEMEEQQRIAAELAALEEQSAAIDVSRPMRETVKPQPGAGIGPIVASFIISRFAS